MSRHSRPPVADMFHKNPNVIRAAKMLKCAPEDLPEELVEQMKGMWQAMRNVRQAAPNGTTLRLPACADPGYSRASKPLPAM